MSIARRHHTLPQFYLRGFSQNDLITTVELTDGKRYQQSIRKTATENDFYAVPGHKEGPDAFEKALSSVESAAASVFQKLEHDVWPLGEEDRPILASFIALQAVRGPAHRRNLEHITTEFARLNIGLGGRARMVDWIRETYGQSVTPEEVEEVWRQATQPEGPTIPVEPIIHIEHMVRQMTMIAPLLWGRPWTLFRLEQDSLITCDNPVGLLPGKDRPSWSGVGFATAWGITFPLARRLGLLIKDPAHSNGPDPSIDEITAGRLDIQGAKIPRIEKLFNLSTTGSASLRLYHHPADERFVPHPLPDPRPVSTVIDGIPEEFADEPFFSQDV